MIVNLFGKQLLTMQFTQSAHLLHTAVSCASFLLVAHIVMMEFGWKQSQTCMQLQPRLFVYT